MTGFYNANLEIICSSKSYWSIGMTSDFQSERPGSIPGYDFFIYFTSYKLVKTFSILLMIRLYK